MGTSDSSSEDEAEPTQEVAAKIRKLVVFEATESLVGNTETATAFLQALIREKFQFKTANGETKICGEDFLNLVIPRAVKVKKPKKSKTKNKGTGKRSVPGNITAQEPDLDVLQLDISKEENDSFQEPFNPPKAGPSDQAKDRGRSKGPDKSTNKSSNKSSNKGSDRAEPPKHKGETKRRKSSPSPVYQRIKFFHGSDTEQGREAKMDRPSRQLLVKGLPFKGAQEKILNDLMESLSTHKLGRDGHDFTQEHIMGAHRLPPAPGEKTATTKITLDSQDTKLNLRLAAERGKVFGDNGSRSPFFRDITLDLRKRKRESSSPKSEDKNPPRKDKHPETPSSSQCRGGDPKGRRPAPPGTHIESKHEERYRTAAQRQDEIDRRERERIEIHLIKRDQQVAKRQKLEHQQREEESARENAKKKPIEFNALPVQPFRAINEVYVQEEEDPPGTPENIDTGSERFTVSETEESTEIEVFPPRMTSDEEAEIPNTESEEETLRDDEHENEPMLEPEYQSSDNEEIRDHTPSPEREVTFTPQSTKNAKRNAIKRKQKRLQKTQNRYEEQKKKTTIKKRLYGSKKSAFLRIGPPPPKNTHTENQTDSDAKADARRRESQESIEEVDPQGRRLPKNKKTHHRQ